MDYGCLPILHQKPRFWAIQDVADKSYSTSLKTISFYNTIFFFLFSLLLVAVELNADRIKKFALIQMQISKYFHIWPHILSYLDSVRDEQCQDITSVVPNYHGSRKLHL